jgi:pimeloyl-ACP methyl ester carboxylesterase
MAFAAAKDGTQIYFKDWGSGPPVVFSHGWPLIADAWDPQLKLMVDNGFRVVAHDRRGGGRSGQPWKGNDLDTYAEDLASVISTFVTSSWSVTRPAGERSHATSADTAPVVSPRRFCSARSPR